MLPYFGNRLKQKIHPLYDLNVIHDDDDDDDSNTPRNIKATIIS